MDITADQVVAAVALRWDGRRVGWMVLVGGVPEIAHYYSPSCKEVTLRFFDKPDAFEKAKEWCRGFQRHPDAQGAEP